MAKKDLKKNIEDKAHRSTISLCVIMRDQETKLPEFLEKMAPQVDEVILVDTGSFDDSVEVAEKAGTVPIKIEWQDNFSAARNVSLEKATKDYVLVLDPDEIIDEDNMKVLRSVLESSETDVLWLSLQTLAERSIAMRVWKNKKEYRFINEVYEEIDPAALKNAKQDFYDITIEKKIFEHDINRLQIAKRNIKLLNALYARIGATPEVLYYIASEYFFMTKYEKAAEFFERSVREESRFRPMGVRRLAISLKELELYPDIITGLTEELKRYPDYTDLWYIYGLAYEKIGDFHKAIECYEEMLNIKPYNPLYVSYQDLLIPKALNGIGFAYMQNGDIKKAEEYFLRTVKLDRRNGAALLYLKDDIWKIKDPDKFGAKLDKALAKK